MYVIPTTLRSGARTAARAYTPCAFGSRQMSGARNRLPLYAPSVDSSAAAGPLGPTEVRASANLGAGANEPEDFAPAAKRNRLASRSTHAARPNGRAPAGARSLDGADVTQPVHFGAPSLAVAASHGSRPGWSTRDLSSGTTRVRTRRALALLGRAGRSARRAAR